MGWKRYINNNKQHWLQRWKRQGVLSDYIKIERTAFKNNPDILDKLKASGPRSRVFAKWLEAGKLFYSNALSIPEILTGFSNYNISVDKLQQGQQFLLEAETASIQKTNAFSHAQVMYDKKVLEYKKLLDWWRAFRTMAQHAMKKNPQLLEQLKIVIPSRSMSLK